MSRFAGLTAISLGMFALAATAFLQFWHHASNGEHDIEARGGIFLFVFLPWILLIGSILVAGIAAALLRPRGTAWWRLLGLTLGAGVVAAILEFLPPLFLVSRTMALVPAALRPASDFALAALFIIAGAVIAGRAPLTERTDVRRTP